MLALGAHTDDIELGCGGTLSRLNRQGSEIMAVAFSRAEASRPPGTPEGILEQEFRSAMTEISLSGDSVRCLGYPVRTFGERRQQILDDMINLRRIFDPDLVITMASTDTHQDHSVIHNESIRAFRNRNLLAYQAPWNQRKLKASAFVVLAPEDVDTKVRMLAHYETQHALNRPYVRRESLEASLRFYGLQCGNEFAEAFEPLSLIAV